ncbi:hypothetical protein [Sandarakinorhabdus sp.]|uniref:hypothetical protein n=1 Tax=Sandarakinorhabdus sp. TaxID=1916663 RepID=UPI003F72037F
MPMPHPLDPAFAKIKRADTHINDLDVAVRSFLRTDPYRLISEINAEGTEEIWSFKIDDLPNLINDIAADAVHNLRTPLDKMLVAAAVKADMSPDYVGFPAGQSAERYKQAVERQRGRLPEHVIKFLEVAEVYPEGKDALLFAIHDLDIRDKHREMVVPINLGFSERRYGSLRTFGGYPLRWGSRRGTHMVPAPDARPGKWDMIQAVERLRPTLRMNALTQERYLEFKAPHDDMEVMTTTPGATVQIDITPTLNLAFSGIRNLEAKPIINVLNQMSDSVTEILIEFRSRFF